VVEGGGSSRTYLAARVWSREQEQSAVGDLRGCDCWFMERVLGDER
jgi:hypothetical protein